MLLKKLCIPAGRDIALHGDQIVEGYVDVDKHVGIVGCPGGGIGTLRELMPYHSGAGVLVFGDEGESLTGPVIFTRAEKSVDSNESVAGKEPCVLRTPGIARGTVTGHQPAA